MRKGRQSEEGSKKMLMQYALFSFVIATISWSKKQHSPANATGQIAFQHATNLSSDFWESLAQGKAVLRNNFLDAEKAVVFYRW